MDKSTKNKKLKIKEYIMSIGYACLTIGVLDTQFKTCRKESATEENLYKLIDHNLTSLENIIDYVSYDKVIVANVCRKFLFPFLLRPVANSSSNKFSINIIFVLLIIGCRVVKYDISNFSHSCLILPRSEKVSQQHRKAYRVFCQIP